jgi:hypothetical protein
MIFQLSAPETLQLAISNRCLHARAKAGPPGIGSALQQLNSASRLLVRRAHFGRIDEVKRIFVITHPYRADRAAVRAGTGAARASRMAASAVRPARRPVATMEQRSA